MCIKDFFGVLLWSSFLNLEEKCGILAKSCVSALFFKGEQKFQYIRKHPSGRTRRGKRGRERANSVDDTAGSANTAKRYARLEIRRNDQERGEGALRAIQELILREIAGEHILIPVGQTALKVHGMITLSESGLLLWNRLQEECTEEDLVEALLAEYQVDRATAEADVGEFLNQMDQVGILCGRPGEETL